MRACAARGIVIYSGYIDRMDEKLAIAAREGDDAAFAELIRRHADALFKFAYRYMRTEADAEDIAQETFVRAWRNLKKFDVEKGFRTWLFAIAKNAALDAIKKKKPFLFSQFGEDADVIDALIPRASRNGADSPDSLFDRKALRDRIAALFAALPLAYRKVFSLRYEDDLKFREIAKALGEPIDTVKSRHRRGLALLKELNDRGEALRDNAA